MMELQLKKLQKWLPANLKKLKYLTERMTLVGVGDIPKFKFNTEKLNNMGWSPKLSSKEAVKLAIDEIYTQLIR